MQSLIDCDLAHVLFTQYFDVDEIVGIWRPTCRSIHMAVKTVILHNKSIYQLKKFEQRHRIKTLPSTLCEKHSADVNVSKVLKVSTNTTDIDWLPATITELNIHGSNITSTPTIWPVHLTKMTIVLRPGLNLLLPPSLRDLKLNTDWNWQGCNVDIGDQSVLKTDVVILPRNLSVLHVKSVFSPSFFPNCLRELYMGCVDYSILRDLSLETQDSLRILHIDNCKNSPPIVDCLPLNLEEISIGGSNMVDVILPKMIRVCRLRKWRIVCPMPQLTKLHIDYWCGSSNIPVSVMDLSVPLRCLVPGMLPPRCLVLHVRSTQLHVPEFFFPNNMDLVTFACNRLTFESNSLPKHIRYLSLTGVNEVDFNDSNHCAVDELEMSLGNHSGNAPMITTALLYRDFSPMFIGTDLRQIYCHSFILEDASVLVSLKSLTITVSIYWKNPPPIEKLHLNFDVQNFDIPLPTTLKTFIVLKANKAFPVHWLPEGLHELRFLTRYDASLHQSVLPSTLRRLKGLGPTSHTQEIWLPNELEFLTLSDCVSFWKVYAFPKHLQCLVLNDYISGDLFEEGDLPESLFFIRTDIVSQNLERLVRKLPHCRLFVETIDY